MLHIPRSLLAVAFELSSHLAGGQYYTGWFGHVGPHQLISILLADKGHVAETSWVISTLLLVRPLPVSYPYK